MATKLKRYADLSPNTRRAYDASFRTFCRYAAERGRTALPIDLELAADWLEAQAFSGASTAALRIAVRALDHAALRSGGVPPSLASAVREARARARRVARLAEHRDRRRTRTVTIRLTEAELGELSDEARASRYSPGGFIRNMLFGPGRARRLPPTAA